MIKDTLQSLEEQTLKLEGATETLNCIQCVASNGEATKETLDLALYSMLINLKDISSNIRSLVDEMYKSEKVGNAYEN